MRCRTTTLAYTRSFWLQLWSSTTIPTQARNMSSVATPQSWSVRSLLSSPISFPWFPGTLTRAKNSYRGHQMVLNINFRLSPFPVVQQFYQSEVNNEYVIRGNSAVMKCSIPSFVADFVEVISWTDTDGNAFALNHTNYGKQADEWWVSHI